MMRRYAIIVLLPAKNTGRIKAQSHIKLRMKNGALLFRHRRTVQLLLHSQH